MMMLALNLHPSLTSAVNTNCYIGALGAWRSGGSFQRGKGRGEWVQFATENSQEIFGSGGDSGNLGGWLVKVFQTLTMTLCSLYIF